MSISVCDSQVHKLLVQVRAISVTFNIGIKIRNLTAPATNGGPVV